ncbi:MAG: sulfate adenylyltransferase [Deltaproteobacteria bacterium]|nr:sulfate adenylyltransferase [Deltaproteobacteria bacterium]
MTLVAPHGGALVDRITTDPEALRARAKALPAIALDARELADLELIAIGAASPLTGFVGRADYEAILAGTRLADGTVWPFPFTLAIGDDVAAAPGVQLALIAPPLGSSAGGSSGPSLLSGRLWGVLTVTDVYARDTERELDAVYGTRDPSHPGVAYTLARPARLVGGTVEVLPLPEDLPFAKHRLTPRRLRAEIEQRGWKRVAGFQTRNPIHRAHEHLTKLALEVSDGIVIHPLVGETKSDDVPAAVRFAAYEALIAGYYPAQRTILAAFPAAMRYAGPKEALFHALVRKNYGIDQLIVGRDHAGVGSFYPPLAAQEIFETFPRADVGVAPLKFEPTFFCRACDNLASARTCPHDKGARVELSGTKVRETLKAGGHLPKEFTRPEIAEILRAHYAGEPQGEQVSLGHPREAAAAVATAPKAAAGGFILWFTGLSGAGKSTLANALSAELARERRLEILDGDEVRTHLSKGLGFSKEDRDTNIHRIGFVARTLAQHGVGVVTAAISPYAETRRAVRELAEQRGVTFVEVFANAPLEALVARDVKGLYKKALAGEVQHFTGVSDPYEAPASPDLEVRTDRESVAESVAKILGVLRGKGLIAAAPLDAHAGANGKSTHATTAQA